MTVRSEHLGVFLEVKLLSLQALTLQQALGAEPAQEDLLEGDSLVQ
jgi:hypothetical protein